MKKLVLLAVGAAALALPAAPASADPCTPYGAGANNVSFCSERVWERNYFWVECSADSDLDGTTDKACPELFRIQLDY